MNDRDWDKIRQLAKNKLAEILYCQGWVETADKGIRDWSIYEKNNSRIRCYVLACRSTSFSRYITGYWIMVEAPAMSGIKRRFKVTVISGDGKLAVGVDEGKLLSKIADVT